MNGTKRRTPEHLPLAPAVAVVTPDSIAPAPPDTQLPGRWLGLAWAVWVVSAALAAGVLLASIPGYVLAARHGDFPGLVVAAPAGMVRVLDLAGASNFIVFTEPRMPAGAALPWWTPVGSLLWWLSLDIIPLALTIAVLRFRLFDLDILIRRTLVYRTLTAILGAVYVAVVVGAQAAMRAATGQTGQQAPFIVACTLLVVALFNPLRRRLQAVIDRRFYRRKYDAERTLAAFGAAKSG